jgi:hypothetical protein
VLVVGASCTDVRMLNLIGGTEPARVLSTTITLPQAKSPLGVPACSHAEAALAVSALLDRCAQQGFENVAFVGL